jgi:MFS family permease
LVIAIRHFSAGQTEKALLAASFTLGLLLTPFMLNLVARMRIPVTKAAGYLFWGSSAAFALAALFNSFPFFFWGMLVGLALQATSTPLITALWRQNVPDHLRGQLFSLVTMLGIVVGLVGALFAGWWVERDVSAYTPLVWLLSLVSAAMAFAVQRIPSNPPERKSRNPLANLSYIWKDRAFGHVSLVWMIMGLANLATLPLRTEYIAVPEYGMMYSNGTIVLLVAIVPELIRIPAVLLWGRLFDRVNFITVRLTINALFAASIVAFFLPSIIAQIVGSIFFGLATGGGAIAWNLWVTKFAPKNRTAEYMSVHTFLTGCRGLVGPLLAFHLIEGVAIQTVTLSCAGLIVAASLALVPLLPMGQRLADEQPRPPFVISGNL